MDGPAWAERERQRPMNNKNNLRFSAQIGHLDRRNRRFGTFVAVDAAAAIDGLLLVVVGQKTEDDRNVGLHIEVFDALGHAFADEFEMHRLAFDHAADRNHHVDILGLDHFLGAVDELKAARNVPADDVFSNCAAV